jgi:hypothetical protein
MTLQQKTADPAVDCERMTDNSENSVSPADFGQEPAGLVCFSASLKKRKTLVLHVQPCLDIPVMFVGTAAVQLSVKLANAAAYVRRTGCFEAR